MSPKYNIKAFSRALGKDNPLFNSSDNKFLYLFGSLYKILAIFSKISISEVSEPNDK